MKTYCRLYYRVPFSETDAMGIVHHSNHARYLERGRVEFLRLIALPYSEVVKAGFHFPLTEMRTEFKRPLVFDDVILIETEISKLTRTRMSFTYRIYAAAEPANSSLATELFPERAKVVGETHHCCTNMQNRPVEMSPEIFSALEKVYGGGTDDHD
jgi:acyl-CoA thioester hydrolase